MWLAEIVQPPPDPNANRWIEVIGWQIEICKGNRCAAAILAYFFARHYNKLKHADEGKQDNSIAEAHGLQPRRGSVSLWFRATDEQIESAIYFYKRRSFPDALELLENLKFISVLRQNPNPKFTFDKSRYFKLNPPAIQAALCSHYSYSASEKPRSRKSAESSPQDRATSRKSADNITNKRTNRDDIDSDESISPKKDRRKKRSPERLLPDEMRTLSEELIAIAEAEIEKIEAIAAPPSGWRAWIKRSHDAFVNHCDQHERLARNWQAAFRNYIAKRLDIGLENGVLHLTGGRTYEPNRRDRRDDPTGNGTGGKYARAANEHAQHFGSPAEAASDRENPVR